MEMPWLDEIEAYSSKTVREIESAALRRFLRDLTDRSPFYNRKFDSAGIDLDKIRTVDDLRVLPFTEKSELRESLRQWPPLGSHLATDPQELLQVQATSGTTGAPSFFGLTRHDLDVWSRIGARGFYAGGFRPGDLILHGWGMSKGFAGGVPAVHVLQSLGCTVLPIGGEAGVERLLTIAALMGPVGFCTGPNFAIHAGNSAPDVLGYAAQELAVRSIVVGGEPGGGIPAIRDRIQGLWNATCCEMMGNSDVAPIVFAECQVRAGMHNVSQGLVHVELIDVETLEPITMEPGAEGELVFSALARDASPLVRFRTGDQAEVLAVECECGRTSPRVRCFGRTDDMLIVRGINVWPSAVREVVLDFQPRTTGNMRIIADFPGHSTERRLRVRIEHASDLANESLADLTAGLEQRIQQLLAFRPDLELVPPGTLDPQGVNKTALVERLEA